MAIYGHETCFCLVNIDKNSFYTNVGLETCIENNMVAFLKLFACYSKCLLKCTDGPI